MDYRITDAVTDPQPAADSWHSERLLRLPDSQWCFRPFGTLAALRARCLHARNDRLCNLRQFQ